MLNLMGLNIPTADYFYAEYITIVTESYKGIGCFILCDIHSHDGMGYLVEASLERLRHFL